MIFYKRLLCIILCISMILSLVGCGQAETTPTQSEAAPAEATQVAVDSYLAGEGEVAAAQLELLLDCDDEDPLEATPILALC